MDRVKKRQESCCQRGAWRSVARGTCALIFPSRRHLEKVWRTLSTLFSTARTGTRKDVRPECRLTLKRPRSVCGCMVSYRPTAVCPPSS
eukprot:3184798-Amphidinium_carterae.1